MRKIFSIILILSLLTVSMVSAFAAGTSIMYVKTDNGRPVNVRSSPNLGDNVIGTAAYGQEVLTDWGYAGNDGWTRVIWGSMGDGYIMSRFLVDYNPGSAPNPASPTQTAEAQAEQRKLEQELASETAVASQFYIVARPARTSGWVNFRSSPSTSTTRIRTLEEGKELIVVGETTNWYKARDPETNKVGYVAKQYTAKVNKQTAKETSTSDGTEKLGTLNVNGKFDLTCKLPKGYSLQVVNVRGNKIVASILPSSKTKPQMYLSIAYDETYSDVKRMNDLSDEDLALLEETYQDMNEVAISYAETGHGTKLLIARETGSDTDFVDILAIYQGYFIEFNMTPNPAASSQTLSDKQVQMCIDFLTDLDFVPVK